MLRMPFHVDLLYPLTVFTCIPTGIFSAAMQVSGPRGGA
jgi:hypothetical protein